MDLKKITWDLETIEEWLQISELVERTLPPVRPCGYKSYWPDIVYSELERLQMSKDKRNRFTATSLQKSIYDEVALNWYKYVDSDVDKDIVKFKSNNMGATRIGRILGLSRQTVDNRYKKALAEILKELKRKYVY